MESVRPQRKQSRHDQLAPFWAIGFVILCGTGLSTIWIDLGAFWKGYVLDMTGPAWNYILFRNLYKSESDNRWTRFFTPGTTFILFIAVCLGIEGLQYYHFYDSTFDPWDLPAYVSILTPLFLIDVFISDRKKES